MPQPTNYCYLFLDPSDRIEWHAAYILAACSFMKSGHAAYYIHDATGVLSTSHASLIYAS